MSLSQTLLPLPFKRPDKKVKSRMLSMPNKLRAVAMELIERVRLGLDIPSRAEVLDLAARIEAISTQMSRLEAGRAADSKLVEELRQGALATGASGPQKIRTARTKSSVAREQRSASGNGAEKKSPEAGEVQAKPKARTRKRRPVPDHK